MAMTPSLTTLLFVLSLSLFLSLQRAADSSSCCSMSSSRHSNFSSQVSNLSRTLANEFCLRSRVGGPKCASVDVSSECRYGFQDYIDSLAGHFSFSIIDGTEIARESYEAVRDVLDKHLSLVNAIEEKILALCEDAGDLNTSDISKLYSGGSGLRAAVLPEDTSWSDTYGRNVSLSSSVYRVPDDVNITDDNVRYDIVKSLPLDDVFVDNMLNRCGGVDEYCYQYFGSVSGVLRLYPAWESTDSFDPRIRPWYVEAASSSIEVVILLDTSFTMTDDKLRLAKELVIHFLNTLGENAYVNVIAFNGEGLQFKDCLKDNLVKLSSEVARALSSFVEDVSCSNKSVIKSDIVTPVLY